jgi:uncharacterized protein (DUF2141 family)
MRFLAKIEIKMNVKKLVLTIAFALAALLCYGQGRIEVTIKNIKDQRGSIRVGLFNNEGDFLKKAVDGKIVKVSGTEAKAVFENVKHGEYAVSVIHDENDNGELDTNGIGIPKEGFAFGNNAMGMFGPPSFDKAKITVNNQTVTQVIELKYM